MVRIECATTRVALLRPMRGARWWYQGFRYVCLDRPAALAASVSVLRSRLFHSRFVRCGVCRHSHGCPGVTGQAIIRIRGH